MGRRSTKGWHLHRRHQKGCAKGQIQQPKTKRGLLTQKPHCLGGSHTPAAPPRSLRGVPSAFLALPCPQFCYSSFKARPLPPFLPALTTFCLVSLCPAPKSHCTDHLLKTARQILCQYRAEFNTQTCRSNWGFLGKGQGKSVRAGGKLLRGIWLDSEGGRILAKGAWQDPLENEALRPKRANRGQGQSRGGLRGAGPKLARERSPRHLSGALSVSRLPSIHSHNCLPQPSSIPLLPGFNAPVMPPPLS